MSIAQVAQLEMSALEAGLDDVRSAPPQEGTLKLIVRRPVMEEREVVEEGELDAGVGLVGDMWADRASQRTGAPNLETQVTVMSARVAALVSDGDNPVDWAQAGDQLYVDLDLSEANLPPGSRLEIGSAVLEVTEEPHLGCGKFVKRFGVDAMKLVNSEVGRALRLRGVNTKVVNPGMVRTGDEVRKL